MKEETSNEETAKGTADTKEWPPPRKGFFQTHERLVKGLFLTAICTGAVVLMVHLSTVFIPLGIALLIAYILDPVISWFDSHQTSRIITVSGVYALIVTGVLVIGFTFGPILVSQTRGLIKLAQTKLEKHDVPLSGVIDNETVKSGEGGGDDDSPQQPSAEKNDKAEDTPLGRRKPARRSKPERPGDGGQSQSIIRQVQLLYERIPGNLMKLAGTILSGAGVVAKGTAQTILVFFYTFFFMLHFPAIRRHVGGWVPASRSKEICTVLGEIDTAVASFFRGRLIVCLISAMVASVGLFISGIPYWLLIGIASGLLGIVPVFGVVITLVPSVILGAVSPSPIYSTVGVLVTFAVVQWVVEPFIGSFVISRNVHLHPVTVIASLLAGGFLFGVLGVVIAIPLVAVLKILARRYLVPLAQEVTNAGASADVSG